MLNTLALIYPYWNVNVYSRFNKFFDYEALIYPYWNVNSALPLSFVPVFLALIYPYWNVNFGSLSTYNVVFWL